MPEQLDLFDMAPEEKKFSDSSAAVEQQHSRVFECKTCHCKIPVNNVDEIIAVSNQHKAHDRWLILNGKQTIPIKPTEEELEENKNGSGQNV